VTNSFFEEAITCFQIFFANFFFLNRTNKRLVDLCFGVEEEAPDVLMVMVKLVALLYRVGRRHVALFGVRLTVTTGCDVDFISCMTGFSPGTDIYNLILEWIAALTRASM
jgi:hypothetical protein